MFKFFIALIGICVIGLFSLLLYRAYQFYYLREYLNSIVVMLFVVGGIGVMGVLYFLYKEYIKD